MRTRTRITLFFVVVSVLVLVALEVAVRIATANGFDFSTLIPRARAFASSIGVGSVALASAVNWATGHLGSYRLTLPSGSVAALAFSFTVFFLAGSFVGYWAHRLMHLPQFWHLHRFHHAATELNLLTSFRVHPLEQVVFTFFALVSPMTFLKVPNEVLLIQFFWSTTFDVLAHSQLRWDFGWLGRWIVLSPAFHQIHHSVDPEHQDLHFGTCPLWDRVFGTWYNGPNAPSGYGLADPAYERRPATQFLHDIWIFYAGWAQRLFSPVRRLLIRDTSGPATRPPRDGTVL